MYMKNSSPRLRDLAFGFTPAARPPNPFRPRRTISDYAMKSGQREETDPTYTLPDSFSPILASLFPVLSHLWRRNGTLDAWPLEKDTANRFVTRHIRFAPFSPSLFGQWRYVFPLRVVPPLGLNSNLALNSSRLTEPARQCITPPTVRSGGVAPSRRILRNLNPVFASSPQRSSPFRG